jgi:hypothetical protein
MRPDGPAGLDRIVERCLRKLPAERYLTTQELVVDLEALHLDAAGRGERTTRRRRLRASDERFPEALGPQTARTWWRAHQVVIMALYVAATAWSWRIGEWYRLTIPAWIFLTIGVGSMLAGTMRGHLLFTDVMNAERIRYELSRSRPLIIIVDVVTGLAIFADGALLISTKPTGSLLTIGLAVGVILASVLIEPATTDAAFPRGRGQDVRRKTGARRQPPSGKHKI